LRNQTVWLTLLFTGSTMLTGCTEPQRSDATFCLEWPWACLAIAPMALVPHKAAPIDPDCTHLPRWPLPDPVKANSVVLLDIDAVSWFGPSHDGEPKEGPGHYDVIEIGGALMRSHLQSFELKAPEHGEWNEYRSYSELARGGHPKYLRFSIRPAGSPGCEVYEREVRRTVAKNYMHESGMTDENCIAVEGAATPVSRYAFAIPDNSSRDYRAQMREIVDLSTGKAYAAHFRAWDPPQNCPPKEVRQQFIELIQPESENP
jgi:hypothetical protein